jgi:hypothetical protein
LIHISDLKLFETCSGCCLEGIIVGEAIQPMTGGTLLMLDSTGNVVMVCFYNFLADGLQGSQAKPFLQKMFPIGAKITVAEPFTKIFRDGQRGISVDNRSDIKVEAVKKREEEVSKGALEKKIKQGNNLFAKKCYSAAMDVYVDTLHSTEFISTLLSNRSQALASME